MAKKKFYAVRAGITPGIYDTWAEAEVQVKGFQGAEFKSFPAKVDAEAFMTAPKGEKLPPDEAKAAKKEAYKKASDEAEVEAVRLSHEAGTIVLYTDGSRKKVPVTEEMVFGYSVIPIENGKVVHPFGGANNHKAFAVYENVAGETMAVVEGLKWVQANRPNSNKIVVFYDYTGIEEWALGRWKAKNIMSQRYVAFVHAFRKETGIELVFHHVKGHTQNQFNELADKFAGEAIDDFIAKLPLPIA